MWGPPRIVVIVTALAACASAFTPPLSLGLSVAPRASSRPLTLRMVASADIELWEAGFAVVPSTQAGGKWRNVRNVPGVLRHLLNPDSPDFRPELQVAWEQADKKQRDAILAMQARFRPRSAPAPESQLDKLVRERREAAAPASVTPQPAAAAAAAAAATQPPPVAGDKGVQIGDVVANALAKLSALSRSRSDTLTRNLSADPGASSSEVRGAEASSSGKSSSSDLSDFRQGALARLRKQLFGG